MKDMAKIRLFYSGTMALILPRLRDRQFCIHTSCKSESSKIFNFLVSNERYDKNKTFLLQCYGIDFALIKRYCQFCIHTSCKSESSQIFTFFVSNERYDKNKTFLLWCYGIDFALIKRYCPFCLHTSCKCESS